MENNVIVNIDTKLYNNIVSYCEANAFNPVKYIEKALRERIATDKYGDLNERVAKNAQAKNSNISVDAQSHIVLHETELVTVEPPVEKVVEKIDDKPTETAPETSEASRTEEKTIKKKRTLKSK